jgi:hypothetical protein
MNKFILTALMMPFVLSSYAQGDDTNSTSGLDYPEEQGDYLKKGVLYGSGRLSFTGWSDKHEDSNGSSKGPKQSNLTILPEAGIMLSDKWAAALGIGFQSSTGTDHQSSSSGGDDWELKDKSNMFLLYPRVKHVKRLSERLYCVPSFGFMVGFGGMSNQYVGFNDAFEEEVKTDEYKEFSWDIELRPGFDYWLSDKVALMASYGRVYIGGSTQTSKEDSNVKWKSSSAGIDLNLSTIQAGLIYKF